jgi:hypothetical protein
MDVDGSAIDRVGGVLVLSLSSGELLYPKRKDSMVEKRGF